MRKLPLLSLLLVVFAINQDAALPLAQQTVALQLLATSDSHVQLAPGTYVVKEDLTLESCLCPSPGAKIKPAKGVTVRLKGGFVADPMQHCFDISSGGKFSFVPATCSRITPQHFGASGVKSINNTRECQAAIDAGLEAQIETYFPAAHYLVDKLRADAPAQWIGDGKHKSIVWASDAAAGVFIEDTGNAVAFSISEMSFYGNPKSEKVTDVIKLGFNKYPWGSGAILDNIFVYDFPGAIGFHLNQNISKISNVATQNCRIGIRALGNGLNITHAQICASRDVSVELHSPVRVYDLEIEAPLGHDALYVAYSSQCHIFGLHISLSQHTPNLINWQASDGCVYGCRVDVGPSGSYTNFLAGVRMLSKPADFTFEKTKQF